MSSPTFGQRLDTRHNNFDFLRFFFATLVILSHSYVLLRSDGMDVEIFTRMTGMEISLGALSVACFFTISGFLITQSWLRTGNARDYAKKRILRIYPGWTVALLIGVLFVAPVLRMPHSLALGSRGTYLSLEQLLLRNCGPGQVVPGPDPAHPIFVNGSTWTIPFEITCYGLTAALGMIGILQRRTWLLVLTSALLLYVNWPTHPHWLTFGPTIPQFRLPYFGWLRCLPLFAVYFLSGSTFYVFRDRIPHSPWLLAASVALVALTMKGLPLSGLYFTILPTFGFYVLFYLALLPLGRLHAWAKHGDLSFGIYLYSFPVQHILTIEQFRGYHLSVPTLFLVAWVLSCGAAALSWRFVERPFLKLKPRSPGPPAEDVGVPAVPGLHEQTA